MHNEYFLCHSLVTISFQKFIIMFQLSVDPSLDGFGLYILFTICMLLQKWMDWCQIRMAIISQDYHCHCRTPSTSARRFSVANSRNYLFIQCRLRLASEWLSVRINWQLGTGINASVGWRDRERESRLLLLHSQPYWPRDIGISNQSHFRCWLLSVPLFALGAARLLRRALPNNDQPPPWPSPSSPWGSFRNRLHIN